MSAWIGPLGALIEFKCPSAVEGSSEDPHVYFTPLGGDRATTTLGDSTRPRVWDVSVDAARPDQVAAVQAVGDGAFGPGPFVFIPPAAPTLNLLGKRDAYAKGVPPSGYAASVVTAPLSTPEGWTGSYYVATSTAPTAQPFGDAPVLAGKPVTGKVFAQALEGAESSVQVLFYTAGHDQIGSSPLVVGSSVAGEYLATTATAPEGAAYARLLAKAATIAHPQITWTAEARTWSPSKASAATVASPLSDSVRRATGIRGQEQITDHRFTVTELRA